jgi:hypothetical protein
MAYTRLLHSRIALDRSRSSRYDKPVLFGTVYEGMPTAGTNATRLTLSMPLFVWQLKIVHFHVMYVQSDNGHLPFHCSVSIHCGAWNSRENALLIQAVVPASDPNPQIDNLPETEGTPERLALIFGQVHHPPLLS